MDRKAIYNEQVEHYRLCDEAAALGIPTSLDDPRSARTIAGLKRQIERAKTAEALRMIYVGAALDAETENELEERGLIAQSDMPYATLTADGRKLIGL